METTGSGTVFLSAERKQLQPGILYPKKLPEGQVYPVKYMNI